MVSLIDESPSQNTLYTDMVNDQREKGKATQMLYKKSYS